MPTLTVRNVDADLHDFLRRQAAAHGRSMEAEVRAVLKDRMRRETRAPSDVAAAIRARFADIGGAGELEQPPRAPLSAPPDLGE